VTEPSPRADHYSYSVYADPAMAEAFVRPVQRAVGRLIADERKA
jgi:hypothetical protein